MRSLIPFVALVALGLASCASSSGVYQVGTDTYRITATAITSFGGEGTAKASVIRQAQDTCAKSGKHAEIVDEKQDAQFTQGSATVTFKCMAQ